MFQKKLIILAALSMVTASPAFAQDLAPISTMLNNIVDALTGPVGIAVATLAVVGTGFLCMLGRLNWGWFAAVLVGIVLIFSAETIVQGFAG